MVEFNRSVFIFRRDLRLHDNTALISALSNSKEVIPLFILDSAQQNHDFFSSNAFEFMLNSLVDLKDKLKSKGSDLLVLQGDVISILKDLKESVGFDAIFINEDYTPFSKERDNKIKAFCSKHELGFVSHHDYLLNPPGAVLNKDGGMYKVFTAFYKASLKIDVSKPKSNKYSNYFCPLNSNNIIDIKSVLLKSNPNLFVRGGRIEALALLNDLKNKKDYREFRDFVFIDATSKLSAHFKFGTISVREVYHFITANFFFAHPLSSQLYWRDFFTHILFFYPKVLGASFKEKYDKINWWGSDKNFKAWSEGNTGFPLIDAAMRQLNDTGWMHGRVRMLVASFLVKNLGIDWRRGERYFASKLVDFDPAVNNGNWQWCASTGCDAQPYFRIFNPLIQQQKFDVDCIYIKKWVPELRNFQARDIHLFMSKPLKNYPLPIVDYKESFKRAKEEFSSII